MIIGQPQPAGFVLHVTLLLANCLCQHFGAVLTTCISNSNGNSHIFLAITYEKLQAIHSMLYKR